MNACNAVAAELDDAALGAVPSNALATHLTSCAACATLLERKRAIATRIGCMVAEFARADPPPELAERILAGASSRRPQRRPFAWRVAPIGVAFVAALLIIASAFTIPRGAVHPPGAGTLAAWRSPTASLLISHSTILTAPFTLRGLRGDSRSVRS